jgi:two-component system sensor histidine kinase TctE
VPQEILPLTRTIDDLFGRVRIAVAVQEEFIADAAHQLRTPLAGLQLHAGQAIAANSPAAMRQALEHVLRLTASASRTSTQLLALTRAQVVSPRYSLLPLDLAALARNALTARIDDGVHAKVDLGYHGLPGAAMVKGDATSLRELLDNLIDNALTHLGNGSQITVAVEHLADGRIALSVEDDGPGVATEFRQRLGERFFRPPGDCQTHRSAP